MGQPKKKDPVKYCERCGVKLERARINGRLEDRNVFLRRKYCSLTCANSKPDSTSKQTYLWRARKLRKDHCEACGTKKSLQAHHIDQNQKNNAPENIETLCKHCHDFWHATQKRLGLPIAGRMPPLF
jgi:5-methylcytosine-specific restriction endonuclease McrA